jgi:DNA-binding response OmpR family regulator
VTIDFDTFSAWVGDRLVDLTAHEFDLLATLVANFGRVMPIDTLERAIWGGDGLDHSRHLHVIVHRIRRKLAGIEPAHIRTVRFRGYGFLPGPPTSGHQ